MKIDAYAHIIPPKIRDFLLKNGSATPEIVRKRLIEFPSISDLECRFQVMDKYPDRVEVLTLARASVDDLATEPKEAIDLAQRINDEMAELIFKYPDRFIAATAVLSLRDMDAALTELDRAINQLSLRGLLIRIPINGKQPVDLPAFMPLYERMCQYNLPIWFHPARKPEVADYPTETHSKYDIFRTFGLPYETTVAMSRLVFSGVLKKYPNLKIITHHCGGMVPFYAQRIINHYHMTEMRMKKNFTQGLTEPLIEYFRRFYNDTAQMNTPSLMCAYHFFGADHLLFGIDMPFDSQLGEYGMRNTIEAIEQMDVSEGEKKKIFEDNARRIMRLPV
ncbi:amidohydrolase family protein [Chloroflexota bacterium]